MKSSSLYVALAALLFIWQPQFAASADCQASTVPFAHMQIVRIGLLNAQQQHIAIETHLADQNTERAAGYQYICADVIARTTILFRYSAPIAGRFHMHNVKAPLDIGFFDESGMLIQYMVMHPYKLDAQNQAVEVLHGPMQKFQYALEAAPGFFQEHGLSAGSSRLLLETLP